MNDSIMSLHIIMHLDMYVCLHSRYSLTLNHVMVTAERLSARH